MSMCRSPSYWKVVHRLAIDDTDHEFLVDTHREAYMFGRRFVCCAGAISLRIYSPDGELAHEWSRIDHRWHDHMTPATVVIE